MKTIKYLSMMTILLLMLAVLPLQSVAATSTIIFNSIPDPLPGNLPSQPYQAQQAAEVGDYIQFAGTARNLSSVTVTMSSWAKHSDYPDMPAEGFTHPLTLNIYNVDNTGATPALGTLIKSVTQNFVMQWRPDVGDPSCPDTGYGAGFAWKASDGTCYNGVAFNVVFDLSSEGIVLPDEIIYGIASNTQTWGYAPIGTPGPYNSLNFAVNDISGPSVGTDVEPDSVFWNTQTAAWYADGGTGGTGIFRRDTNWTGYVPAIRFDAVEPCPANVCTLTVDLSGTWLRDITVQLWNSDGTTMLWAYGNQHGAVRNYNVAPGTYDLKLIQGSKVYLVDNLDCSNGCNADVTRQTLTVDLSGIWLRDITVQLYEDGGGLIWSSGNQHSAVRTYNVLPGVYDLKLVQGDQVREVADLDCSTGGCNAGDVIADLGVDLNGTWLRDVTAQLKTFDGKLIWSAGNQHSAVRHYNVLKGIYDLTLWEGPKSLDVADDLDCTGEICEAVPGFRETLTVDLSGTWLRDITVQLYNDNNGLIWSAGNQHGAVRTYNVLKGVYDLKLVEGSKSLDVADIDCNSACNVGDVIAVLSVDLSGTWANSITTELHLDDGSAGTAGSVIWAAGNQHGALRTYNVLKSFYDVALQYGSKTFIWDAVNCTGETCTLDKSTLTVDFPEISSVHVYVYKSNGVNGTVAGTLIASQTYKNNQAVFPNLTNGKYDVKVVKGAKVLIVDDVVVFGNNANAGDIVATLTVNFPGISSVHTYVKVDNGIVGTATGGDVENRTYKNDETTMNVLKNTYDVVIVKGAKQLIVDAVNCTGETCVVDDIVATLTVNFPGISSVHTYVKTATGGDVDNRTYKNGTTSLAVLKSVYKVVVVKGAQQNTYDVDCSAGDTCTLDGIVATMTVNFPGISSVHTYVKTTAGGDVDNRTYQNNSTSLAVLKSTYKVVVVKGAQQNIYGVDCTGDACTLDGIVATMTVNFPGLSSVHTYVKTPAGGDVDNRTYKNDFSSMTVLKASYKVVVVKGAQQNTYNVDCSLGDCTLDGIVATMTVNFPGINSVHTYVKTLSGGDVDNRTYKNNFASLVVLEGNYRVVVVKGAKQKTIEPVDCTDAGTCTVQNIVATLTIQFPGLTNVHAYVKVVDGKLGEATGGDVENRTYQNNSTSMVVLRNYYDVVLVKNGSTGIADAVNCTGATCTQGFSNKVVSLKNSAGNFITNSGASIVYQPNSNGAYIPFGDGALDASGWETALVPSGTHRYQLTYLSATQEKQTSSNDVIYQTQLVTVELRDSNSNLITGSDATVVWQPGSAGNYVQFGNNADLQTNGYTTKEVLPLFNRYQLTYLGATQEKQTNSATVTYQTQLVTVELRDSNSNLITGSDATIVWQSGSAGNYVQFGSNAELQANGYTSLEVLPLFNRYRLTYLGATQEKQTNGAAVTYQTRLVTVELRDASSNLITGSNATIVWQSGSAGNYVQFGSNAELQANGYTSLEVLPLFNRYRMTYLGTTREKQSNGATVIYSNSDF